MQVKYINKSMNGLKNSHEYVVKIFEPKGHNYTYTVHFIFDITDNEEMDKVMNYASEISLRQNFKFNRLELKD